jgi:hypothetical protein
MYCTRACASHKFHFVIENDGKLVDGVVDGSITTFCVLCYLRRYHWAAEGPDTLCVCNIVKDLAMWLFRGTVIGDVANDRVRR